METVKVSTSQHIDIDYPVAGLGERIAARLIDFAIFIGIFLVFMLLFAALGILDNKVLSYILLVIYAIGFVCYDLLCEISMNGQSIGKRLLKIKVISLDGAQPSLGQYLIRWVFRIVDFVLTQWLGALICVAVTENKQRIGDIVAGTTLIKTVPRTQIQHIAFHPVSTTYVPVFEGVNQLTDRDIELIHEVLMTYHKTHNAELVYRMSAKVASYLHLSIPSGMNELDFLKTLITDYNQATAR